jgi:hypothetical protein
MSLRTVNKTRWVARLIRQIQEETLGKLNAIQ